MLSDQNWQMATQQANIFIFKVEINIDQYWSTFNSTFNPIDYKTTLCRFPTSPIYWTNFYSSPKVTTNRNSKKDLIKTKIDNVRDQLL